MLFQMAESHEREPEIPPPSPDSTRERAPRPTGITEYGLCTYHLANLVQRRLLHWEYAFERGLAVPVDSRTTTESESSSDEDGPHRARRGSTDRQVPPSDDPRPRQQRGAPFIAHHDFTYAGRDRSDCEPGELGQRIYIVDHRILKVFGTVHGCRRSQTLDLLRCQQFFDSDCEIFGYKYQGVVYTFGFHNHE
jgi:hypothetical protein